jgi:phage N-6-adenine-methyltransferase
MAPKQKPGESRQNYRTPVAFLDAVKKRLGIEQFDCDICADAENAVAPLYFTAEDSALDAPTWKLGDGWNWMNPEYRNIEPWVKFAFQDMVVNGSRTAILIPASVGANWWRDYVDCLARALLLNGRLAFMPDKPNWLYPKDCALLLYSPELSDRIRLGNQAYEVWNWRE